MRRYLAVELPEELAREAEEMIHRVRSSPRPREHRAEGVNLILRLTEHGLEAYFLRSVQRMGLGFVAETATRAGLKTAFGAIAFFIRRLAGGLDDEQIRRLADRMDELLMAGEPRDG